MRILGIETSCDETAIAIVEDGVNIISSSIASSAELHAKTGGIIPEQAARQQIYSILPVLNDCLTQIDLTSSFKDFAGVDAIAVTYGPGLIGSLLVGVELGRTLAYLWEKPLVPVNHLIAHLYANWIDDHNLKGKKFKEPEFPALGLVVSGGHTDLVYMKSHKEIEWISGTRDDAAGEAFDKIARLLGLEYPGGPSIAKEADQWLLQNFKFKILNLKLNMFPRPMIDEDNFDWSFSGLKTAVARETQKIDPDSLKLRRGELAAQVQEAIVDCLVIKSIKAIEKFQPKSFIVGGGVSANKRLRNNLQFALTAQAGIHNLQLPVELFMPNHNLSTDNAAAIAACGYFHYSPIAWNEIQVNPELTIIDTL